MHTALFALKRWEKREYFAVCVLYQAIKPPKVSSKTQKPKNHYDYYRNKLPQSEDSSLLVGSAHEGEDSGEKEEEAAENKEKKDTKDRRKANGHRHLDRWDW